MRTEFRGQNPPNFLYKSPQIIQDFVVSNYKEKLYRKTYLSDVRFSLEKLKHSFSFNPSRARTQSDGYE